MLIIEQFQAKMNLPSWFSNYFKFYQILKELKKSAGSLIKSSSRSPKDVLLPSLSSLRKKFQIFQKKKKKKENYQEKKLKIKRTTIKI